MMLWKGGGVRDREQPDGCSGAALPPPTGAGSTVAGGAARGGRAVALAHRRPAGEARPRSPPPLSPQHFEAGAESYELLHGSVGAVLQRSVRAPLQEFARADSLESLPGELQAYLAAALVAVPTAKEPSAPM